jgi:hypothetical protein
MAAVQEMDNCGKAPMAQAVTPHPAANTGGPNLLGHDHVKSTVIHTHVLSSTDTLSTCSHKTYGVLNGAMLCRDFAAHDCYEEAV